MRESDHDVTLQIAQVVPCTEAEGPGRRFAIWFQGCPLRCPECCNPQMLPFEGGKTWNLLELLDEISLARDQNQIEGITLIGGEPFAHAASAAPLARETQRQGLSVMVFSGFVMEAIESEKFPHATELLKHIDILVDGPYQKEIPDTARRWVGSTNQRVHFLTDRYRADDPCWRESNTGQRLPCDKWCWRLETPASNSSHEKLMRQVSRFESNLLKIVHAVLGRAPVAQVLKVLVRRWARPRCLSRDCVELVKDALAKGCTHLLATGGWRSETFLRSDQPKTGRLWQRTRPADLGLEFSGYSLDFLIWLTEADVSRGDVWQPYEADSLTVGDRLLLALALDAVAETDIGPHWAGKAPFRGDGFCALLHPELMTHRYITAAPSFDAPFTPAGQNVLEALQFRLAEGWLRLEVSKATIKSHEQMQALGRAQRTIIDAYLQAADQAGRRDLACWMLNALRQTVSGSPPVSHWIGGLDVSGLRIAQRTAVYRDAVAFLATATQLSTWQQQATATGYFDEGYAGSQIWKNNWERYNGDATCDSARQIVRDADPLTN